MEEKVILRSSLKASILSMFKQFFWIDVNILIIYAGYNLIIWRIENYGTYNIKDFLGIPDLVFVASRIDMVIIICIAFVLLGISINCIARVVKVINDLFLARSVVVVNKRKKEVRAKMISAGNKSNIRVIPFSDIFHVKVKQDYLENFFNAGDLKLMLVDPEEKIRSLVIPFLLDPFRSRYLILEKAEADKQLKL